MIVTKVARILSPTQVILAAGTQQGVKEGMEFVIFVEGAEIRDPENGESLGKLEIVKGKVRVSYVQERICHATTFSRVVSEVVDPIPRMAELFRPREVQRRVYDKLTVEATEPVEADTTVRVGDVARSVD